MMYTNLIETVETYFQMNPEFVVSGIENAAYGIDNNPFICSSQVEEKAFLTIPEKIVLLLTRHSASQQVHVLASPHMAAKVTLPNPTAERMHKHHYFELFGVLDGQLDIRMEHTNKRYLAGDFCLINQSVFHAESYSSDFSAIYISLWPDYFEELMSCPESSHFETFRQFARRNIDPEGGEDSLDFTPIKNKDYEDNTKQMSNLLSMIFTELLYRHTGYMDIVDGCLKRLFAHMQHSDNYSCVNTRYPAEKANVYHDMLTYIHKNRRKISRAELAEALNYNSNYLADLFRGCMGISLSAYIRDICMQESAKLLLNTDMPVHEIVRIIGYENRTVFYQHFQDKYKMTPKAYRESLHGSLE